MSEEAKKLAEQLVGKTYFYVTEERAFAPGIAEGWPEYIPAPHTRNGRLKRISTESLVPALNTFASQVCEQREKHPYKCKCVSSTGIDGMITRGTGKLDDNGFWEFPCPHEACHAHIYELRKRAEAAELALQTEIVRWQQRIYEVCRKVYSEVDGGGCDSGDELDFSIAEIEQTFAHLQAALQAKEQELAQIIAERKLMRDLFWPSANEKEEHIYEIRNGHTKEFVEAHVAELVESELAQSRQQAVADAREEICELAETAAIGNSEPSRSTLLKLVQVIRSLTPPPALTKEK